MTNNRTRKERLFQSRIAGLYTKLRLSQVRTKWPLSAWSNSGHLWIELPALRLYFRLIASKFIYFQHEAKCFEQDRPYLPCSVYVAITMYIAATHNSPSTSTCTALPITLPSTTLLCTQLTNTKHICVSSGKMAQDVGMVRKCCGIIPI